MKKYLYPCILTTFILLCLCLTVPFGSLFGSEGDWFSQHTAIAEQFRQIFYETGRIFPDFTMLGGGSSIYDFSYYGFLRPDVLLSFLLPGVPMSYIISIYAILGLIAGTNLCFFWLKKHCQNPFFSFLGAMLFSCSCVLYQAHHQIMFVNYLPFMILALIGIDRLVKEKKSKLLTLSLFLVYLHSYYFSIAVLAACLLYFLYRLSIEIPDCSLSGALKIHKHVLLNFCTSIVLSIGMAAILLIPTALDLLSTQKDAGASVRLSQLLSVNLSMESLLYSAYGCGLTILCLYTLLLSIRRKSTRFLSILLLLGLTLNSISYVLSGFLYIRYKVLIPLVPLLVLLCTKTLEELQQQKIKHSLPAALCCLIPAFFSEIPILILVDSVLVFLLLYVNQKFFFARLAPYLLLCILPAAIVITISCFEEYISVKDQRQILFTREELEMLSLKENYRFDCLAEPFVNSNQIPLPGLGKTTMYSSITNSTYADFFYNTMKNPIRVRNRVALLTDANPFFSYLMGIRYIQTKIDNLPYGYQIISEKGRDVIAENSSVLPIAYVSSSLMSKSHFQKLEFPYTLEALQQNTIVPDVSDAHETGDSYKADDSYKPDNSALSPVFLKDITNADIAAVFSGHPEVVFTPTAEGCSFSVSKEVTAELPLSFSLSKKCLLLSFEIASEQDREVTITINGSRNKLSASTAPYPNHNTTFTYLLSSAPPDEHLSITLSPGDYSISNFCSWTYDTSQFYTRAITPLSHVPPEGNAILQGSVSAEENSYFVTSLPYRKGYLAYTDNEKTEIENVNQGFVGFPLSKGAHEIKLYYHPPGKAISALISFISFSIFILPYKRRKPL